MRQEESKNHKHKIKNTCLVGKSNDSDDSGDINNDNNSNNNNKVVVLMVVVIRAFIEYALHDCNDCFNIFSEI